VVYYSLDTGAKNGAFNPELLHKAEDFIQWLEQQHEVEHVSSITEVLKRLNQQLSDNHQFKLPNTRAEASQLFLSYELSLPLGSEANQWVSMDRSRMRIAVMLDAISAKELAAFDARAQLWIKENFRTASNITLIQNEPKATSVMSILCYTAIGALDTMIRGNLAAILFIGLLSMCWFRSILLGAITIIPNLAPTAIALGLWSFFDMPLNLAGSVVFCVAFGVIIDDTIHFTTHYQRLRLRGMNYDDAIRKTFIEVGPALVKTTVLLSAGFACLAFSTFALNAILGAIVSLTLMVALIFDFTVLPLLLKLYRPATMKADENNGFELPAHATET
jgi:predicted RND superfamily exporter protein